MKANHSNRSNRKVPHVRVVHKAVEQAWLGIPTLTLGPELAEDKPTLIDSAHFERTYAVEHGEVYTVRLGLHCSPKGQGAFTKASPAIALIPIASAPVQHLLGLFSPPQIAPAAILDGLFLVADTPFHLEIVQGSITLECSNSKNAIPLQDEVVEQRDDFLLIHSHEADSPRPEHFSYSYDFITFQVEVVAEQEQLFTKQIRVLGSSDERWTDFATLQFDDKVEVEMTYVNNTNSTQEHAVFCDDLPSHLDYQPDSLRVQRDQEKASTGYKDVATLFTSGIDLGPCLPGETVTICYKAAVTGLPSDKEYNPMCLWGEVCLGTKAVRDYVEMEMIFL